MPLARCDACQNSDAKDWILWECLPVPAFGNPAGANVKVATVSINPSEYEFRDSKGQSHQLEKRLPMLEDFGASERKALTDDDVKKARERRDNYFTNHPYSFFTHLGDMLFLMNEEWSYTDGSAVHLDAVACATKKNWSKVLPRAQTELRKNCGPKLAATIAELREGTQLIANGSTAWKAIAAYPGFRGNTSKNLMGSVRAFSGELEINQKRFPLFGWSPFIPWCDATEILAVLRHWRERPKAAAA
jgi:hypothetical protein